VVTAQRRSENLQNVPISVSVVTAQQLETSGVTGIADISMVVPNLNVANGNGYLITHLRGVGTLNNGPGIENPVALYVDGVYYANQTVGLFSFNNISQIEVLDGPQGTLFGRNATGGLISVTTEDPTQAFKLRSSIGASNYRGIDGNVYVSGGLASDLAADLSVQGSRRDGWGRNEYNGEDVYAVPYDLGMRSKWIYTPGDWKFTFIGDYSNVVSSNNALAIPTGSIAIRGLTPPASYAQPWDVDTNQQPFLQQINEGGSIKVEYSFGPLTVSNLAAYRRSSMNNIFDYDGTALPLEGVQIRQGDYQYSDELQLTSRTSGPLTWVAGAYYFRSGGDVDPTTVSFASSPAYNPSYPLGSVDVYGLTHTDSISGYGQATYKITDQFSLTGGVRYSYEYRTYNGLENGQLLVPGNPIIPLIPPIEKSESFDDPTYRLAVSYQATSDLLLYTSFNTGFKSGGFNTTAPTDPGFLPETLKAYEIGEKADLFGHSVRWNSAAFYYEYSNIQTEKPEATGSGIINGGKAHLYGLDTDITVIPVRNLELRAALSLLHSEYVSFPDAPISTPGGGVPVTTGSVAGNALPYAPKATLDLGVTYTIPLTASNLVLHGQYLHNSGFYFEPDNVAQQPTFQLFNSSVRWKTADEHYSVLLYGNNLANKAVISNILTTPTGQQLQTMDAPRTYGVRFTYQY